MKEGEKNTSFYGILGTSDLSSPGEGMTAKESTVQLCEKAFFPEVTDGLWMTF